MVNKSKETIMSHGKPKESNRKCAVLPSPPVNKGHLICLFAFLLNAGICHGDESGRDEWALSHWLSALLFKKA